MIAMSTAASRPMSTEAVRKRPARAAFTSSLIAGAALTAVLLAPAGVANAQPAGSAAVRTVAHSAPLVPSQNPGSDAGGQCVQGSGGVGCWFPATAQAVSKSAGSGDAAGGAGEKKKGGGIVDFIEDIFKPLVSAFTAGAGAVSAGAGAITSIANTVNPFTSAIQGLIKGVTGK